jgi:hypothetical protein
MMRFRGGGVGQVYTTSHRFLQERSSHLGCPKNVGLNIKIVEEDMNDMEPEERESDVADEEEDYGYNVEDGSNSEDKDSEDDSELGDGDLRPDEGDAIDS